MNHQSNDPFVTLDGVEVVYPNGTVGLKPLDLRVNLALCQQPLNHCCWLLSRKQ